MRGDTPPTPHAHSILKCWLRQNPASPSTLHKVQERTYAAAHFSSVAARRLGCGSTAAQLRLGGDSAVARRFGCLTSRKALRGDVGEATEETAATAER